MTYTKHEKHGCIKYKNSNVSISIFEGTETFKNNENLILNLIEWLGSKMSQKDIESYSIEIIYEPHNSEKIKTTQFKITKEETRWDKFNILNTEYINTLLQEKLQPDEYISWSIKISNPNLSSHQIFKLSKNNPEYEANLQ